MLQKIAIGTLGLLLGALGYFAYNYAGNADEGKGLYAPNAMHRVQKPPIMGGDTEKAAIVEAAKQGVPLKINGKEVILVPVKAPEQKTYIQVKDHVERQLPCPPMCNDN